MIAPDLLAEIISTAADISLMISPENKISSVLVNQHHRSFGQIRSWENRPVCDVLMPESQSKLLQRLQEIRGGDMLRSTAVELTHLEGAAWAFPIRYSLHLLGHDGSVLMLGRDLRPIAEMQQRLVSAQIALERDYETQREMETRYRVILEATRDALLLVSMANGRIVDLNNAAAIKLGGARSDLVGAAVAQEFEGTRRSEFLDRLTTLAAADATAPVDLVAKRSKRRLTLVPTVFRAAGEKLMLCRMDDPDDTDFVPDELAANLGRLYQAGVDAMVFTSADGVIRTANEAFLNLVDAAGIAVVRGRSLADFLSRGAVDLKVLLENTRRSGQMRLYATKLVTEFEGQVSVEISVSQLNDGPLPGMAMVIRDVSRADTLRSGGGAGSEDGMRDIMELVGSSPLREIVAQTADVVEKMCIETAVQLTHNNRVAAAEMLGLSRQSLYVKLRKYGLIGKEGE